MAYSGLKDAVVIVTGGARGIGAAIAESLGAAGAKPVLVDVERAQLAATTAGLRGKGVDAMEAVTDITDPAAVGALVADVIQRHGRIDGLVNAAGILHLAPILEHDPAAFERVIKVNVTGTFVVTQAVAREMVKRKKGSVVTIASVAAHQPRFRQSGYATSKAAVAHLMRAFGLELASSGVRFNSVSPGPTETDMIREVIKKTGNADQIIKGVPEEFRLGTPLGRMAQVDDIARAVMFMLSDDACHITLQDLIVDGGHTLGT